MEYKSRWYRRAELFCLVLAVILQIVCLTAPGWQILIHRNNEHYSGIFYVTACTKDECETRSKHDIYYETVSNYRYMGRLDRLLIDREYNEEIKEQVFVVVILASTIAMLVMHTITMLGEQLKRRHLPRLTAITVPYLAINCGLMIKIVVDDFVELNYMLEVTKGDYRENHYMGFPYCIAMYIASFVVMMITVLLYVLEICKFTQKPPKPPPRRIVEDDYDMNASPTPNRTDSLASTGVSPIPNRTDSLASTGVSPMPNRTDSLASTGVDNKAYDIKL